MKNLFKTALMPLYGDMLQQIQASQVICTFCLQWGKDFPVEENAGILFVGKATNGWVTDSRDIDVLFGLTDKRIFARWDQMEWVHKLEGSKKGVYNTRKSAFWRVVKQTSQEIYGDEGWYNHVAWSNLYKVSFSEGNPNGLLKRSQTDYCKQILEEEIRILSPRFVIFLTSGWERDFMGYLLRDKAVNQEESFQWTRHKTHVKEVDGVIYVCSPHPQGKSEAEHVKVLYKVIEKYIDLNKQTTNQEAM